MGLSLTSCVVPTTDRESGTEIPCQRIVVEGVRVLHRAEGGLTLGYQGLATYLSPYQTGYIGPSSATSLLFNSFPTLTYRT